MLNSFPIATAVGVVLGILAGLGTGGGSLLILWLTLALSTGPAEAKAINLLFFLPSALIACLFRWRQGKLEIKKVLPAILAGSTTAAVFAFFGNQWESQLLQKAFGVLLLFTGVRELCYKPRKK